MEAEAFGAARDFSKEGIWSEKEAPPWYKPNIPFAFTMSLTACVVVGGLSIFTFFAAAMEYSSCRRICGNSVIRSARPVDLQD
jgi:hypothetical protein